MIIVSGYYGYGNLGDEAILAALIGQLDQLGIRQQDIWVLSGNVAHTQRLHGVTAIPRYDVPKLWKALAQCELMISGGGSLWQDSTSWRTVPYYLSVIELALLRKVPAVVYAQGIGPIANQLYRKWVSRIVRRLAGSTVRDNHSAEQLRDWGAGDVAVSADPVWVDPVATYNIDHRLRTHQLLLNLRPYDQFAQHKSDWIALVEDWERRGWRPSFLALGPGDRQVGLELQEGIPRLPLTVVENWKQAGDLFNQGQVYIGMRLHGLILAARHGCYPVALDYDPKVSTLAHQLQIPSFPVEPLDSISLSLHELWQELPQRRQALARQVASLQERTAMNMTLLQQVIEDTRP